MASPDIDLNLLRVFDAVFAERSVTRAGERLGITQPATSHALSRMRRSLGDSLFVRTQAGLEPTPFARSLAEPIAQALGILDGALASRQLFDPATSSRNFRLHLSDVGEMVFLPAILARLSRVAPGVRVETTFLLQEVLPDALATGEVDVAIGFMPGLSSPVKGQHLFNERYVCLMRARHPLVGRKLTRSAFVKAAHALVASNARGHRTIEEALLAQGLDRQIALRIPHFMVVPLIIERTDLLVTVPDRVAQVWKRLARLRALPVPVPLPAADVRVYWHERFDRDPGNRWLRDLIVELHGEKVS